MFSNLTNDQKHQLAAIYIILAIAMYLIPLPQIVNHIDLIEEALFVVFMFLLSHQGLQEILGDWGTYKTSLASLASQVTTQVDTTVSTGTTTSTTKTETTPAPPAVEAGAHG